MSIKEILKAIFARIDVKHKWQQDFLLELFVLIYSIQGRLTFENMARYSIFNECTFRRNFKKFFDWLGFNWQILTWGGLDFSNPVIAAVDCSYLPKAGKSTYGLDKFFSSVADKAKRGLEISLLSLIDTVRGIAWALDVKQTPAALFAKEGSSNDYTRIDFYFKQIIKVKKRLEAVKYFVADGYYAKIKVFTTMELLGKHLITKFRPDSNLRYLHTGPHEKRPGRRTQYAGKVDWKNLDLDKWDYVGKDDKYS